jgi:hypothetical protein
MFLKIQFGSLRGRDLIHFFRSHFLARTCLKLPAGFASATRAEYPKKSERQIRLPDKWRASRWRLDEAQGAEHAWPEKILAVAEELSPPRRFRLRAISPH